MDEVDIEKQPLNDLHPSDTKSTVIVSEDGDATIIHPKVETHTILSAIIKSTDGKFHRLSFDETDKKLELLLLKGDSTPTKYKMSINFSEIVAIRNSRVKLGRNGLPRVPPPEDTIADKKHPNAIFIYYAVRKNVYIWRIREAVILFTTTHDKKQWIDLLQTALREYEPRPKSLLIFINPYGGKGKAKSIYDKQVDPILALANIKRRVVLTERANHAYDILQEIEKDEWTTIDGVVSVGGDGLFNECLCSIVIRIQIENEKDIRDINVAALAKPPFRFGIIGAGSANSIVSSVHGVDDCPTAAVHIAIGSKCSVDVCTVHEGQNLLRISANAISYGWLGDVLRDSERYRYLGPIRYQWSALRTTIRHPYYFGRIAFCLNDGETAKQIELPECKKPCEYCEGSKSDPLYPYHWTTDFTHIICCVIPCVSPFTPYGLAPNTGVGDGTMDLALLPRVSRCTNLSVMRKVAMYGGKNLASLENSLHCYRVKRWSFTPGALVSPQNADHDPKAIRQGAWNLDGGKLK
uniref:DAGKc domain-containing protein n=2 Tax=Panagrolaimus davidi TaxID=227884 RepID=A0A914QD89_9BILA